MSNLVSSEASQPSLPFGLSIMAAEELLLVTLRFSSGADREAIQQCMFQILDALVAVEGLSEAELSDLCWEQRRLSATEQCITLRRRFADPDYPQKFDAAFRQVTGRLAPSHFH